MGMDNDVPHFNNQAHTQTHSDLERTRHKARRKRTIRVEEAEPASGNSLLFNFVMLTGILGVIAGVSNAVYGGPKKGTKKKESDS